MSCQRELALVLAPSLAVLLVACTSASRRRTPAVRAAAASTDAGREQVPAPPRRLSPGWLPEGVRPLRYAIDLTVDPRRPGFFGEVRIHARWRVRGPDVVSHTP